MIHEQGLTNAQDIQGAWSLVSSSNWEQLAANKAAPSGAKRDLHKLDEIRQLLMTFGGFTPPLTPRVEAKNASAGYNKQVSTSLHQASPNPAATSTVNEQHPNPNGSHRGKGRGRGRGRGRGK